MDPISANNEYKQEATGIALNVKHSEGKISKQGQQ